VALVTVETRMRGDLPRAMKARDQVTVTALRTALAAIANAEAPPAVSSAWTEPVLGERHEAARLELTPDDIDAIIRGQIESRLTTALELDALSQPDEAATLRAEAAVLAAYLEDGP
jgi:uncharacterized protein YqeY